MECVTGWINAEAHQGIDVVYAIRRRLIFFFLSGSEEGLDIPQGCLLCHPSACGSNCGRRGSAIVGQVAHLWATTMHGRGIDRRREGVVEKVFADFLGID